MFSGQPYPDLDEGVRLTKVPSLDLYREPDPFRVPKLREFRDRIDVEEVLTMWTAGFPEPKTFSSRIARLLQERAGDFDVVHDNQVLGYGIMELERYGLPLVTTIHHPITMDRRIDLATAPTWRKRLTLRRWYGFLRMQAKVARRLRTVLTPSESSAPRHRRATSASTRRGSRRSCSASTTSSCRRPRRGCPAGSSPWPAPTPR